jgi:hypothetical protein
MVAIIGEVLGRPLRYQEIAPGVATQGMVAHGFPDPFVQALMARYARDVRQPAPVTGEVERALGRPAHLRPVGHQPRRCLPELTTTARSHR